MGFLCCMHSHPLIDDILDHYRAQLGKDFSRYRNHAQRVYLACRQLDAEPVREVRYALAAAFHDIGIWTDGTFDYLQPSVRECRAYMEAQGMGKLASEVEAMILWHHKVSRFRDEDCPSVEYFRQADLVDVTMQLKTFGIPRPALAAIKEAYPFHGFHLFLLKRGFRHFLRHPLRPLPMFRR